jgi:hypothetical protein
MRIIGNLYIILILSVFLVANIKATPVMADELIIIRTLPQESLYPDDIIKVSIRFTVPVSDFNSIGIKDTAPAGWTVSVNSTWCTPVNGFDNIPETNIAEYFWLSSYAAGTVFTVVYEVSVPTGVAPGTYNFPDGQIEYYIAGDGPYYADITGDNEVTVVKACTLTVNTVGNGSVSLSPPGGIYDSGTEITLTATADIGWSFSAWSSDLIGSTNPANIIIDGDKTVTATFTPKNSGGNNGGGGGGGGGGYTGTTSLNEFTTSSGQFVIDATAESADGLVKINIPKGTIGKDRNGNRLRYISIKEQTAPSDPPADYEFVCLTYDIGPNGTTLEPFGYLIFYYNDSRLPAGVNEENLALAMWQDGNWVVYEGCIVDPDKNAVTAPIVHFSTYTAMAHMAPAEFEVDGMTIAPTDVYPEESVIVNVTVTNTGVLAGSYDVTIMVNDLAFQTKEVTLGGGQSELITFTITLVTSGEYIVNINGLSGEFIVKESEPEGTVAEVLKPESPTPSMTTTGKPIEKSVATSQPEPEPELSVQPLIKPSPPGGTAWWLIVIYVVAGLFVIGGGIYYFMRRRNIF